MLNIDLLKLLACPSCKSPVKEFEHSLVCTNAECRRQFAVKDGIPVMLIDNSEILSDTAYQKVFRS